MINTSISYHHDRDSFIAFSDEHNGGHGAVKAAGLSSLSWPYWIDIDGHVNGQICVMDCICNVNSFLCLTEHTLLYFTVVLSSEARCPSRDVHLLWPIIKPELLPQATENQQFFLQLQLDSEPTFRLNCGFAPLPAIRTNNQLIVTVALTLHSPLIGCRISFLQCVPPYTPVLLSAMVPNAVAACSRCSEAVLLCTQQLSALTSAVAHVWMLAVVFIFFSGRANPLSQLHSKVTSLGVKSNTAS